jgi:NTE family protein
MSTVPLPPVALALGGGAALGWAHIGVIKALTARGVTIEAVAGTSIGAVVAVCVAGGKLAVLEDIARKATGLTVLRYLDVHFKGGGMLGGRIIERELLSHFGDMTLEELPMPCATLAADLITGDTVTLRTGPIVEAVRASLAIPGIFTPVRRGEALLADGGLVAPVPVAAARSLSTATVIAVNLQGDYPARARAVTQQPGSKRPPSTLKVSRASLGLLLTTLSRAQLALEPADIVLAPKVGHIDVGDFTRASELIRLGAAAVADAWPTIAAALLPHPDLPKI